MFLWFDMWKANRDGSWKTVDLGYPKPPTKIPDNELPWLSDPDDYSELPPRPNPAAVSEYAIRTYDRKRSLRQWAVVQIDRNIKEDKILYGWEVTPEQREVLIHRWARSRQAAEDAASDRDWAAWEQETRADERNERLIDAIESASPYAEAKKFAQEHPFLAGFLGADAVHRLKDK